MLKTKMKKYLTSFFLFLLWAHTANAVTFRTVDVLSILYDTPSFKGKKLFIIRSGTPLEVITSIEGFVKVRDQDGLISWIDKKSLVEKRNVIVTAERAPIRQSAEESGKVIIEAEKNTALDYVETLLGGWIKVRFKEGGTGFIRQNQVWGV